MLVCFCNYEKKLLVGGSPGLVVMGGDSCSKSVGSSLRTVYWTDIFHIYLL